MQSSIRKVVASFIGATIEWHDYSVYGIATAPVFHALFSPNFSKLAGTFLSYREELVEILQGEFPKRKAHEWVERIREVGVPIGPVNSLAEVFSDEHVSSSGILQTAEHPPTGMLEMPASRLLVDGERPPIRRPPPTLGQHTEKGWV
jgi:crotonobetainyl-CoA:carnitine CoA-transferase CaiB-like acyl-CoA transferase